MMRSLALFLLAGLAAAVWPAMAAATPPSGSTTQWCNLTCVIDAGAATTKTRAVTLHLGAANAALANGFYPNAIFVSNDGVSWQSTAIANHSVLQYLFYIVWGEIPAIDWTLTPGLGTKTVYVQYAIDGNTTWKDAAGPHEFASPIVKDTIKLVKP